ncbi:hypothetical protein [Nocardioides sp. SR21]|uniref:hypothetical protein n=1 Tax=Nocardioides sp. SR21 TaxID=2919501 RepID=UPI001FA9BC4D|nr:hypothetical protein [Nocardioides sp. SR21]
MALTVEDQALVADMRQRELHLKRRLRATDAIHHELRRFRLVFVSVVAALFGLAQVVFYVTLTGLHARPDWWLPGVVNFALAVLLGALVAHSLLRRRWGKRLLARQESRLRRKYSGDLHSGRRWLQFYFDDQDISAYVPQILYFLDEGRVESVRDGLALAQESRREKGSLFAEHALACFNEVAADVNKLVVSSAAGDARPSSRAMRFVKSDRPGVWYITTAPEGPKVHELDRGVAAIVTAPTESGSIITSNRIRIARAGLSFADVAGLYDEQVPRYSDGMTEEEAKRELVYELTLLSAKVETWTEHEVVELND